MSRQQLTVANLTHPQEVAFVTALIELGGPQNAAQAALRAGYGTTYEEAERAAAFLLASSRISRAITGEIKARFDVAAAAAFNTLVEVAADRNAPASSRITAAKEILDRSTLGPPVSRSAVLHASQEFCIEDLLKKLDDKEAERAAAAQLPAIEGEVIDVNPTVTEADVERDQGCSHAVDGGE
jgi:hypothetical protein